MGQRKDPCGVPCLEWLRFSLGLQTLWSAINPLRNTTASTGNCRSKGEVHLLEGSYKTAKFILAVLADVRRGKGHSLSLGRVRSAVRKTLPGGGWCSTGAGLRRFWGRSQLWPHLLLVTVLLWLTDWTEWPPGVPPTEDSHSAKRCRKRQLLCEICTSKSQNPEVLKKRDQDCWLKSFVLGQRPSIISPAEAVPQLIRAKGYPPLGGSKTKPTFLSPVA